MSRKDRERLSFELSFEGMTTEQVAIVYTLGIFCIGIVIFLTSL